MEIAVHDHSDVGHLVGAIFGCEVGLPVVPIGTTDRFEVCSSAGYAVEFPAELAALAGFLKGTDRVIGKFIPNSPLSPSLT